MATMTLWTCPECGGEFNASNIEHTCEWYSVIENHFRGKDPCVRDLYDHLFAVLWQIGPVKVSTVKARIIFESDTQFAAAIPRRHTLDGMLWLNHKVYHPLISRVEMDVFSDYCHHFRLTKREDIDEDFIDLLCEAYGV